jgi:hypothetical protein
MEAAKTITFFRRRCMIWCFLMEKNRSELLQTNGNARLPGLSYKFRILFGSLRIRLSVLMRWECGARKLDTAVLLDWQSRYFSKSVASKPLDITSFDSCLWRLMEKNVF